VKAIFSMNKAYILIWY